MSIIYQAACDALASGAIIGYPTESVFGLGVDPFDPTAITKLLTLKQRKQAQGLILISHDLASLQPFLAPLNAQEKQQLHTLHKGYTHTWLVPFNETCPHYLHGEFDTIAVRITTHPAAKKLCQMFGPIVSTSANPHGAPPALNISQMRIYFGDSLYIVDDHLGTLDSPTRIIDLKTHIILRT